jgi:hypothetical protein
LDDGGRAFGIIAASFFIVCSQLQTFIQRRTGDNKMMIPARISPIMTIIIRPSE